jgi:hypothetical protein
VHYSSFRRSPSTSSQSNYSWFIIHSGNLAHLCKAAYTYWPHVEWLWRSYCETRIPAMIVQEENVRLIQYERATQGACSKRSTKCCSSIEQIGPGQQQSHWLVFYQPAAKTKAIQPPNIQITCSRRLCQHYSQIQYYWFIYDPNNMLILFYFLLFNLHLLGGARTLLS